MTVRLEGQKDKHFSQLFALLLFLLLLLLLLLMLLLR